MVEGQASVTMERFTRLSTSELQEIWNKHDTYQYSGADFEAVKSLLEGQGVTVAPVATSEDARLTGIGGWLVLPAIGLVVGPIMNIYNGSMAVEAMNSAYERYQAVLNFEVASSFLLVGFAIIAAFLFFTRKKAAPGTMIALLATALALTVIESIMIYNLSERLFENVALAGLVQSIVGCCIWIPYFLNSKRVRLTFTR